jgi:aspartyl protease
MAKTRLALPVSLSLVALLVAPSASAAGAPEPSPEAVLAELPFLAGDEPNRVIVDLAPEGAAPFRLMLDTGAGDTVLTPGMARQLGVTVRRNKQSQYRRSTRLGRDLQFWIDTDSSDTGSRTGWEYGLLGGEFLDDYVLEIDFPGRKVRFLDPKKYRVPEEVDAPDERVLAVKVIANRIAVPVEVGGKEIEVLLDTGAPDTLILSGKAARSLGIDVDALPEFGTGGTVIGPMEQRFYEAAQFRFAGFDYAPLPVIVAPKGFYNMAMGNDSVLGYDVLRQFVLRIDYAGRRIWLKRTGDLRVTFFGADYAASKKIGAQLIPHRGTLWVSRVAPDGAAAKYGLRDGDAIVPAAGEKPFSQEEVFARIESRGDLTVARQRGDVWLDLVLPDMATPEP